MPYFLYKVFPDKKLEKITDFEKFQDAKKQARDLRTSMTEADNYTVKVMFAKNEMEAELLLKETREPRPRGDD
ncbi:hypothetical protein [Candidatus Venteria ishoeyi]|uniref:Uncharacterized protein n=1 Tax=Candidatus Venteria ishoeyi TaxID=1899563 RepID=A0A1H6FAB6_9GAMM|nr:hypothetical protein [Candidatus Venteria ishoeyi]MDM8545531.1 hypothetical protein [Candidatus Venteria ishoeyi]SEH07037.1 Uncharacterised protein [Candidatus Venteria ishoeyi]